MIVHLTISNSSLITSQSVSNESVNYAASGGASRIQERSPVVRETIPDGETEVSRWPDSVRQVHILTGYAVDIDAGDGCWHRRSIRRVLEQGTMSVVFQPIVDLESVVDGPLVTLGHEALARVHEPPQVGPLVWLKEATAAGLGLEFELTAVSLALEALDALPEPGFLAVNSSPNTAMSAGFSSMLADSDPKRIVVEVTEHTAVDDYRGLREALDELRRIGARIAVDDLGTGSSNLDALLRLQPDIVKLDGVVTANIDVEASQRAIVRALRSFSSDVGVTLIAEDVERKDQLEALLELGVRYGQGFILGWPGPFPGDTRDQVSC